MYVYVCIYVCSQECINIMNSAVVRIYTCYVKFLQLLVKFASTEKRTVEATTAVERWQRLEYETDDIKV